MSKQATRVMQSNDAMPIVLFPRVHILVNSKDVMSQSGRIDNYILYVEAQFDTLRSIKSRVRKGGSGRREISMRIS